MRRSICTTTPPFCCAGEINTWKFEYTTATSLPEGTKLKFDIRSWGRDIDWETPSSDLEEGANVIYLLTQDDEIVEAKEIETPENVIPQYEFILPKNVKVGGKVTIVMGAAPDVDDTVQEDVGNMCQLVIARRRPFLLYIDPKGKGNYDEPEIFSIDIRGNVLKNIRVLAPSFVAKNKRFDITVRFEDEFGNLTSSAPEGTLIDLSYEHLRENLNWKLFVPETGFVILPNLYFNEAGIYRIQLINQLTKEKFTSPPIKCFQENSRNLYWGSLHGESERVDSTVNIENFLRHFRDDRAYNFTATSPFDNAEETTNDLWKAISQNVSDFNEDERFATFLGFQYQGDGGKEGMRLMIYSKEGKPLLRKKDTKSSNLAKIYKTHTPKDLLSIPTFTMGKGFHFDFKSYNPEYERVVEIYNSWGSSEGKGCARPITGKVNPEAKGSIQEALKQNHRFGFVAGGLDDRGVYGDFFDSNQEQYSPGMTAVMCEKHTKEAMLEALYKRSCYATTGARIILGFHLAGHPMGSELTTALKPGLKVNRHLSGFVAGETALKTIEIIRNGEVIHTFEPTTYHYDYYYDDMEPLEKVVLKPKKQTPFVYYYLRVTQEDGHIAWSSPLWVDLEEKK